MICAVAMLIIAWHGYSQEEARVTMEVKDTSLKEIIRNFEGQTKFTFIYNETIDAERKKSLSIKSQTPENALKMIFGDTNIEWKIRNEHITLTRKEPKPQQTNPAKKVTISGYITDERSSEILIGANVFDMISKTGAVTNEFGFFSFTLPAGDVKINFSYIGYEMVTFEENLLNDKKTNIKLNPNIQLAEVVVTAANSRETGINATSMSSMDIPLNILKTNPVLFGEADVMKAIQLLPGVKSGTQGSSGIYVRGGGPDENLILLDGIPLYNVDHLLGLFSIFTPEVVKKATLYKGSFPARFSGRLSSVIDVRTNDGDMHNYHGTIGIGLLSSKLQLEGPLIKGRTSFNISGRRSYVDLMMQPFLMEGDKGKLFFYDMNAKVNHKFSDNSRLFLSFYKGLDKLSIDFRDEWEDFTSRDKSSLYWGNTLLSARWNYIFSPKLFSNTTIAHTNYMFNINSESHQIEKDLESIGNLKYNSGIKDVAYKIDFNYLPSPSHNVKFGTGYLYHDFRPETESVRVRETEDGISTDSTYRSLSNSHIYANEVMVYAEDEFNITPAFSINAGLNFSLFNVRKTTYTSLQPRLSARYQFKNDIAIKASYTKMNQYIHLLSNYNVTLPTDLWVPTTDNIKPMRAHQYSLGAYYTGIKGWELSAETYYKDMRNILEYKDGASFLGSSQSWESKVEMGRGRSYGIELMAQKTEGKTTGWVAYTLAKSERKFDKGGINFGNWFPHKYDHRHHFNLTANHKISEKIDLSASWEFYTGGALTVSEEMTSIISPHYNTPSHLYYNYFNYSPSPNAYYSRLGLTPSTWTRDYIEKRNNYRLPSNHCLNLGINFRKQKKHGERIWSFGVYNAYNAMNPHFVYKTTKQEEVSPGVYESKPVMKKITIFPIIPSFSYTFKF
jgi:Outer membrane receptor for ferrienterochelin and colicins